jgi:predicted  nucleic acid-binding Zn-ribbon protein
MPANAENLRELHGLHQRAKAIRDRLASGPKTLATREQILATRQAALEQARKALKDARAHNKNREVQLQTIEAKIDDLKTKRNTMKKQVDYDAITNQIAHEQASKARAEDEILGFLESVEAQAAELAKQEADIKALADEVARLRDSLAAQEGPQQTQLREIEEAIRAAEQLIPEDQRDQYRRVVKQRGADALAAVQTEGKFRDIGSCTGCFVSVTTQMMNELHNAAHLVFCKTCGRLLYIADEDESATRRTAT